MIPRNHGELGTLCLTEINTHHLPEVMKTYGWMSDLICVVYDVRKEGVCEEIQQVMEEVPNGSKVMLIQTKSDLLEHVRENGFCEYVGMIG